MQLEKHVKCLMLLEKTDASSLQLSLIAHERSRARGRPTSDLERTTTASPLARSIALPAAIRGHVVIAL